ncbi:MAG: hypothetical protein IPK97_14570 [Ahniella sp.]|nr:hypothetical protein [Ahniella sp.]
MIDAQLELAALSRQLETSLRRKQRLTPSRPAHLADDPISSGRTLAERGRIALAREQHEQARLLFKQAQAKIVSVRGEHDPEVWLIDVDYAEWLAQAGGKPEQARELAMAIAQKVKPAIDPAGRWADRLRKLGASI